MYKYFSCVNGIPHTKHLQSIFITSEYVYGQGPNSHIKSSLNSSSTLEFDYDVTHKESSTQFVPNKTSLIKNQINNKTKSSTTYNISNNSSNEAIEESSGKVTADFNGDGISRIFQSGTPFEDEEIDGQTTTDYPITNVVASGNDGNLPVNILDNDFSTRWSSLGIGQSITADLGSPQPINQIDIAWYNGNSRQNHFIISTSLEGTIFTNILSFDSSGTTTGLETYNFPSVNARYVKVTVNGNTQNNWASITELDIWGSPQSYTIFDSGAINVVYGTSKGLSSNQASPSDGRDDQLWTQTTISRSRIV